MIIAHILLVWMLGSSPVTAGAQLFAVHCATCHGVNLQGSAQGPPLINVPARNVDFMLQTGRMPASIPYEQEWHRGPAFTPEQIDALVRFVASKSTADKTLPVVGPGDIKKGREVFAENCQQCHAATGHGDSVGFQNVAPELMDATPEEIAEAVRMGPDVMPPFGPGVIDPQNLNDVIAYVQYLQHGQYNPGGLQLANFGPVPEGMIAWIVGLGLLVLFARRIGTTE